MKTVFRLPSKAIQYGYVEVELDLPDDADARYIGNVYVNYVHSFLEGEQKGLNALLAPSGSELTPKAEAPPGDSEAAAQRLAEGKKPRTVDEGNEMATQLIKQELGATEVEESETPQKPWEKKVDTKPKPWENGAKATPKVADIDW